MNLDKVLEILKTLNFNLTVNSAIQLAKDYVRGVLELKMTYSEAAWYAVFRVHFAGVVEAGAADKKAGLTAEGADLAIATLARLFG